MAEDNLLSTLGTDLLNDLIADLNDEDDGDSPNWLNFEELERELEKTTGGALDLRKDDNQPITAASLLLNPNKIAAPAPPITIQQPTQQLEDAWSMALKKLSQAEAADFLQSASQAPSNNPPPGLENLEEYDIDETVPPPPGLKSPPPPVSTTKPPPRYPITPQNSLSTMPLSGPATPRVPPTPPPSAQNTPYDARGLVPPQMASPPPLVATPIVAQPIQGARPWQSPPPPMRQMTPPKRVYCYPNAPPIPAAALASNHMKERDISFVLHAILRPILQRADVDTCDYDKRYWERRVGATGMNKQFTPTKQMHKEMESRQKVTKKWAEEHNTLGHVAKTNVTRPRALIAVQNTVDNANSEQKQQRAALWKARVVCDQAYQAFIATVDAWKDAPPNEIPQSVQTNLSKLGKCMGLKEEGKVNADALEVLFKLPKGRVLTARVLEQALLPPSSVQVLIPEVLRCLYKASLPEADDRIFGVLTHFFRGSLVSVATLKECLKVVQEFGVSALQTTSKMQCVHAMLQRGTRLAAEDPAFGGEWTALEAYFLELFSSM